MSPEEMRDFENQIRTDETLAEQIRIYMLAYKELQAEGKELLKILVKKSYENIPKSSERKRFSMRSVWITAAVAAVALLIVFAIFRLESSSSIDYEELFTEYYQPQAAIDLRNSTTGRLNMLSKGVSLYYDHKYEEAIVSLSAAEDSLQGRNQSTASFFLGQCYLEKNEPNTAIPYFSKVNGASPYYNIAHWNIALTWLRMGNLSEARERLLEIRQDMNYQFYHPKADELLEKITQ